MLCDVSGESMYDKNATVFMFAPFIAPMSLPRYSAFLSIRSARNLEYRIFCSLYSP